MHEYTRTHTSTQDIDTYILQDRAFKQVNENPQSDIYILTEEYFTDWFLKMQKECSNEIALLITELKRQCAEVYAMKLHFPLRADYNELMGELCKSLLFQAPYIPFEKYCEEGANFTAAAGAYLLSIYNKKSEKQLRIATIQLSGLQWLIGKRDALPVEVTSTAPQPDIIETTATQPQEPTVEEEEVVEEKAVEQQPLNEEDEKLKEAYHALRNIKDDNGKEKYSLGHIYAILQFLYLKQGEDWAKNYRSFGNHFAPLIDVKSHSIVSAISRVTQSFKDIPLDTMAEYLEEQRKLFPLKKFPKEQLWVDIYTDAQELIPETPTST